MSDRTARLARSPSMRVAASGADLVTTVPSGRWMQLGHDDSCIQDPGRTHPLRVIALSMSGPRHGWAMQPAR
jgi:hypothetical protein